MYSAFVIVFIAISWEIWSRTSSRVRSGKLPVCLGTSAVGVLGPSLMGDAGVVVTLLLVDLLEILGEAAVRNPIIAQIQPTTWALYTAFSSSVPSCSILSKGDWYILFDIFLSSCQTQ